MNVELNDLPCDHMHFSVEHGTPQSEVNQRICGVGNGDFQEAGPIVLAGCRVDMATWMNFL